MDAWLIWLIIAVVLLVVEMLTITAAVGMLGVAALITTGFAALGLPVPVQLLAFTVTAQWGAAHRPHRPSAHAPAPARPFRHRSTNRKPSMWCQRCPGWTAGFASAVSAARSGRRRLQQTLVIPAGATVDVLEISGTTALVIPGEPMETALSLIPGLVIALFVAFTVLRAVRIVPQARARNVERLGRYDRTLQPGLNFVIPYFDRVYPMIDLREQVVSFRPQRRSPRTIWSLRSILCSISR